MHRTLTTSILLALAAAPLEAQDWMRFRGPNGAGISEAKALPVELDAAHRAWKTAVAPSSSSPIVVGDRVYLTASTPDALQLVAINASSGELLWQRELKRRVVLEVYEANDSACPTPTSDGENVYAFFPEAGLVSYDADGKERWQTDLGPFVNFYGMASSPIIAGDLVILLCEQQRNSFVIALNKQDGKERWRSSRAGSIDAWTTPIVFPAAGAPRELIVHGSFFACAYDLRDGRETWRQGGLSYGPVCSPILDQNRLYLCAPMQSEYPMPSFENYASGRDTNSDGELTRAEMGDTDWAKHFGWIDADQSGQITRAEWTTCVEAMSNRDHGLVALNLEVPASADTDAPSRELWRWKRSLPSIATPLCMDGVIYVVKDGGIVSAIESSTGNVKKSERLPEGSGEYFASPVAADGKVYVARNDGVITVLRAGAEWEVLTTNDLGEELRGTPAPSKHGLIVRTQSGVSCYRTKSGGHAPR